MSDAVTSYISVKNNVDYSSTLQMIFDVSKMIALYGMDVMLYNEGGLLITVLAGIR